MNLTIVSQEREKFEHIANRHPCFDGGPNRNKGRVHLPVSPTCNIQCSFCKRNMNKLEQRPGVTNKLLSPDEAAGIVDRALELCPEITAAGIAGPGDTLAAHLAIDTFRIISRKHPELINCLSTNGLLLEKYAEELISVSSCVPALIGDDIDSIVENLQSDVAAKLVPVNCEGFKTKVMATAYDAAYNGIMKKLVGFPGEWKKLTETDKKRIKIGLTEITGLAEESIYLMLVL